MLRVLDILLSAIGLILGGPVILLLLVLLYLDAGSPVFHQVRVGQHLRSFTLIKFRTMKLGTASVATHLANPDAVTRIGAWLRRTKLDELPQLWNVLKGDMSLVGPRPCLFNQTEVIAERQERGVFSARPGITGLAQVQGIDMSTPKLLAETDARMLERLTLSAYFGYLIKTVKGNGRGDRIQSGGGS